VIEPTRVDRIGSIAAGALIVGFAALVTHQAIRPLAATRADLASFRQAITILAEAEVSVDRLDEEIRTVAEDLERSRAVLPGNRNLDAFLEQVDEIARSTGTRVVTLTPSAEAEHRLFRELMLEVRVTGSYRSIRDFLSRLENGEQLSRVEQLQLVTGVDEDPIAANVRLALYFAPGPRG